MRRLGKTVKKRGRPATGRDPLVTIRLPRDLIERLDIDAGILETSRSEIIRAHLEERDIPPGLAAYKRTRTAHHEAGHAVVAHIMGIRVLKITIQKSPTLKYLGRCWHEPIDFASIYAGDNRDLIALEFADIIISLAGRASEEMLLNFDSDGGEVGDLKQVDNEFDRLGVLDKDAMRYELYEKTKSLVYRHRDTIRRVARRLMKVKTVTAEEFARLVA